MPRQRITLAKLTRPRLHAPVKRTRLFKLLDQGKQHPVSWVSGPPGSGKTTLVASYLEARKLKTFWYQVDEGDRDPASLFYYLGELAKQSRSRKRGALPFLTAEYLPDLSGFARRYFRELFQRLGPESVLVFDNCQDAGAEQFHLILREACEQLPPGTRLIALSREANPSELARQVTNKRLQTIAWDALKLNDAEARAIAKASAKTRLAQAEALNRQCDGWVGGLTLLLAHSDATARSFDSREAVFSYFAEEVLRQAPQATRELLLRTALFPYTTVSMAQNITQNESAGLILNALYKKQYFIDRKPEGEVSYQYHDLFREFLLERLHSSYDAAALNDLRQRAALILEQSVSVAEAAQLYAQAQDWVQLARLIRAHAETLLSQGRWQTLNSWFERLPSAIIESDPWLALWRAAGNITLDATRAYRDIVRAYQAFTASGDDVGQFYSLNYGSMLAYTVGEPFRIFDQWFPALERQLVRIQQFPTVDAGVQAWTGYLTMANLRYGQGSLLEQGEAWLSEQFFSGRLTVGSALLAGDILLHRAIWPAQHELGERVFARLQQLALRDDAPPDAVYHAAKDLGYWLYYSKAQYAEALAFFDRAIALALRSDLQAQVVYAKCFRILALCALEDAEAAQAALDDIVAGAGADLYSNSAVGWAASKLDALRGNYANALERATVAAEQGASAGFVLLELAVKLNAAVYALQLGDVARGEQILAHTRLLTRGRNFWRFADALIPVLEAEIHQRKGAAAAALESLREGLTAGRNPAMAGFLGWAKPLLPRLFESALQHDLETDTTQRLIQQFALLPTDSAQEHWPWRVKIRTLGTFTIELESRQLDFTGKAPKKVLTLLQAIIALGGKDVRDQDLIDALWPRSDGDAGAESLKVTLLRLRKLLGAPQTIEVQQGRLTLNRNLVWVDAFAFEALADRALGEGDGAAPAALELYRGTFLAAGDDQQWLVIPRERLRRKFVQLIASRAQRLIDAGQYDAAAQVYARGVDADVLVEQFHQGLMRCHLAAGRHAEGMAAFRRLRQVLSITLGAAPSPDSLALFQALQDRAHA